MPRRNNRNAEVRRELEHYDVTLEANGSELPQLTGTHGAIRNILQVIRESSVEMDLHWANRLQASKRHQTALDEGRKLITCAKVLLKQHYGSGNDKLAEFGIQPYRGRSRKAAEETKPPVPPEAQEAKATESES